MAETPSLPALGFARSAVLAAAVLMAATAAAQGAPSADQKLRADYERDLAALRAEHEKALARIRAEAMALEERVEHVHRLIPAQFEADAIENRIRTLAKVGDMKPVLIKRIADGQRILFPDGRPTPYERFFIEVSGQDSYMSVGFFLDRLGRLPMIVELPTLSLEAGARDAVRFVARLAFPCMTGMGSPAPSRLPSLPRVETRQPLGSVRAEYEGALRAHQTFFRQVEDSVRQPIIRAQETLSVVTDLQAAQRPARFYAALSRFETGMKQGRAAFNRARFDALTVIEGAVSGDASRAALRTAFEAAGFVIEKLDVSAAGVCRTFSLSARLKPVAVTEAGRPDVEFGPENRFRAVACEPTALPTLGAIEARGTRGVISASLREIEVADVFHLLSSLGQGSYVVDADVKGRVNVGLERATLDEAIAAIGSVGITVGPGPLRRVSRAGAKPVTPARRRASREHAINLSFKNAVLLDVVRLFEEISGLPAWTAPVTDGRVTILATEVPWDTALEAIASSAGFTLVVERDRLFIGPDSMAKAPWKSGAIPVAKSKTLDDEAPAWDRVAQFGTLAADDLTPVGIARGEEGLKAVAYGPGRMLWIFAAGDALSDASVDRVDATSVTIAGTDNRKRTVRFVP